MLVSSFILTIKFMYFIIKFMYFTLSLHQHLLTYYPDKYNNYIMTTTYNMIYYYSKLQILLVRMNIKINLLMKDFYKKNPKIYNFIENYSKTKYNTIEYVLNGSVISSDFLYKDCFKNNKIENYDFMIVSENIHNKEHTYVNKKIIHQSDNLNDYEQIKNFEQSEVKFIMIEIVDKDSSVKIDLKSSTYNFYLVGNIIDNNFIKYLLNTYYEKESKKIDLNRYVINIIDNNVNNFKIDIFKEECCLHILRQNYIMIK